MSKVRVRFAPSPTGFFHIGSARTALFNWLYAKHTGGTFILRIEDTDDERNSDEYLNVLMDGMKWLGLDWDEGPNVGGNYGPYFQSKRADIYKKYLEILRSNGRAYDKDGAVFFKVSGEKQVLHDSVYGDVERLEEKDFPIFRSNGTPVFHFVNVVDDICMEITHVIRGQDHLTNTNKHIELFKAFGAPLPQFAHIPLILKSEGQGKMSKRDKGALIEEYQQKFFVPAAVRNYLCMLGWNPKNDREIMPIEDIISLFDFHGIIKSNARFDERKMAHFNTEHLRGLPIAQFDAFARKALAVESVIDFGNDDAYTEKVFAICQPKVSNIEGFPSMVSHFFTENYPLDPAAREKVFKKGEPIARLRELRDEVLSNAYLFKIHDVEKKVRELIIQTKFQSDFKELLDNCSKFDDYKSKDAFVTNLLKGYFRLKDKCDESNDEHGEEIPLTVRIHDILKNVYTFSHDTLYAKISDFAASKGLKANDYFPIMRFAVTGQSGGPDLFPMLETLGKERVLKRIDAFLKNPER